MTGITPSEERHTEDRHIDERRSAVTDTDWLALWEELAIAFRETRPPGSSRMVERFRAMESEGPAPADELLDFILSRTGAGQTVVDIGAGTGRWTIPLARAVRSVTAVEPTPAMEQMLRDKVAAAGLTNVDFVAATWEDADVGAHDVVLGAHSIYMSPDFAGFVAKMERCARAACYLEMRLPAADGIVAELTRAVHGRLHDSPNAVVAFNALHALGIEANVLVKGRVRYETSATFEDAVQRATRQLRLASPAEHEALIREVLARRLVETDAGYRWPDAVRSALLWWEPALSP